MHNKTKKKDMKSGDEPFSGSQDELGMTRLVTQHLRTKIFNNQQRDLGLTVLTFIIKSFMDLLVSKHGRNVCKEKRKLCVKLFEVTPNLRKSASCKAQTRSMC